jgi:hypothetical protein
MDPCTELAEVALIAIVLLVAFFAVKGVRFGVPAVFLFDKP